MYIIFVHDQSYIRLDINCVIEQDNQIQRLTYFHTVVGWTNYCLDFATRLNVRVKWENTEKLCKMARSCQILQ